MRHDWKSAAIGLVQLDSSKEWYEQLTQWILAVVQKRESYQLGGELAEVLRMMLHRAPAVLAPDGVPAEPRSELFALKFPKR